MKIKVVLKEDLEDGGFNVSCPALPGCMDALNDRTKSSEGRILEIAL
jgi:predicted RNase H-like HicB family nuclease